MAKKSHQKLKLLYLAKIFTERTDENHALTLAEIMSFLENNNISADRKTLYQDFEELKAFGLDIISEHQGKTVVYYLASRDFELAELKLLVDSVQAAKFITERKSHQLIKKLQTLASCHDAQQLQRQVLIAGRVKTMNESILINVDHIHTAINDNRQISFQYFQWTPTKKRALRHDGRIYVVSPWQLVWDDENYYLIAYDATSDMIKHYRVDKMLSIQATDNKREGACKFKGFDVATYSKRLFGMLGGEHTRVTLECTNDMSGILIDRFGQDIVMLKKDEAHFITKVDVVPSNQFLGWIIGLSTSVKIISPKGVVERLHLLIQEQHDLYQ